MRDVVYRRNFRGNDSIIVACSEETFDRERDIAPRRYGVCNIAFGNHARQDRELSQPGTLRSRGEWPIAQTLISIIFNP